jgi:sec-independent protein translocase protein TatA
VPSFGLPELLIIFVIGVLLFGASRLPRLGQAIGAAISNFRGAFDSRERK